MEELQIITICKKLLPRLKAIGYEKYDTKRNDSQSDNTRLNKQLIFPVKFGGDDRISEQELRQVFIEVFKEENTNLFYSIETPTQAKYYFGNDIVKIKIKENGQSALIDMCVFKKEGEIYNRILNIEFKHQNAAYKSIAKDILKLMHEKQNGLFITLLKNTNRGTLCNKAGTGILDKLHKSLKQFGNDWNGDKSIIIVIISLNQETMIYSKICKNNLGDLKAPIFTNSLSSGIGNITEVIDGNGWKKYNSLKS
ncbi:hypothetical protein [Hanstruepera ponticola]|uniref:hypothetical protein n=1 Tax=Hanstruepera ponticola TaxID=2042995 RepID=UPI00177F2551|nr:hypothetical protein [Hanstruepera ponticola]